MCARFCDNHDANELLTPSPSYLYSNVNEPLYNSSVTIVTKADKRIRHSRRLKSSLAISQAPLENKSDH